MSSARRAGIIRDAGPRSDSLLDPASVEKLPPPHDPPAFAGYSPCKRRHSPLAMAEQGVKRGLDGLADSHCLRRRRR